MQQPLLTHRNTNTECCLVDTCKDSVFLEGSAPKRKADVRLHSSVPSGDRSANPASVPGCSGLQPALLSVSSAQKCSGAGRLASPSGVSRAARSAASCQSPASGHRASRSEYTRGQSRETGSLTRLFGSVETTAKFVSMGHAQCRTRLSWRSAAAFQLSHSHAGGSRAGSGNGTRSEAIEVVPPLDKQSGFYSRTSLFMGRMGVASYFRSKLTEPLSSGCSFRAGRVSDQIRGLVVTSDLEDAYFPSAFSLRPCTLPRLAHQNGWWFAIEMSF